MKLTGPQQIVLADAKDGLVFRGKHNEICKELRRLGLLKYEPQQNLYSADLPETPAWRVLTYT